MTVEDIKREEMKKELCRLVDEGWITYKKEAEGMSTIKIERVITYWEVPGWRKFYITFHS